MVARPKPLPVAALVVLLSGIGWGFWRWSSTPPPSPPKAPPPGAAGQVVPEHVRIEPGAIVADTCPPGWSHRVVKSVTFLESGDVDSLPAFARDTATRFRTVVLADVRPGDGPDSSYALHRVGVGLALEHRGRDTVVNAAHLDGLGISLSLIDKVILSRAEAALDRGRLAARTPTFALYDAAVELLDDGRHRSIYLRYALLVDPSTGALRAVVWPVAESPADRDPPAEMVALAPGLVFRCGVHVLAQRALGKVPVSWLFAMTRLPPGVPLPMPPALRAAAILDPETPEQSANLERLLRDALESPDRHPPRPPEK